MVNKFLSNEDRIRIIQAYLNGSSPTEISAILGFKRTTILSIITKYRKNEEIERKQRGGVRRKSLTEEDKNFIMNLIDNDCGITLRRLKERCESERGVLVSQSTLKRCIDSFHYTMKRVHIIPERRNSACVIETRAQYANDFVQILSVLDDSKLFFIDEIGFNVSMRTRRGRSLVGTRAVHNVTAIRARNISVCCAMNKNGIFEYLAQTTGFNTNSFVSFINVVLDRMTTSNISEAVFVMDNVPFHKCSIISEIITAAGHRVMYLPPYSPFLNPIENMFSKWKQHVRSLRAQNEAQLLLNIENAANTISEDDCKNCYRHMLSFLPRCIRKESIIDE